MEKNDTGVIKLESGLPSKRNVQVYVLFEN